LPRETCDVTFRVVLSTRGTRLVRAEKAGALFLTLSTEKLKKIYKSPISVPTYSQALILEVDVNFARYNLS